MGVTRTVQQIVAVLDRVVDPGILRAPRSAAPPRLKARSSVTSNRSDRSVLRSDFESMKPSSGMIARRRGSTQ
jgi:hypothetical protein